MTVVAYKAGVIACDSAGWKGSYYGGSFNKITRTLGGVLAGAAGEAGCIQRFLRWVNDGCREDARPELEKDLFDGFCVQPDGTIIGYGHQLYPYVVDAAFFCEGSGGGVAMGALAHGATAESAVEIACQYADGCRGPVQVLHR